MKNNETKILFDRLKGFEDSKDYLDLKGKEFNNPDEIARILSNFRNPKTETMRIIYMKDDKVLGYESITSNTPNSVLLGRNTNEIENAFCKFESQMNRLNANGYYLMHNHCSESSHPSYDDYNISIRFKNRLKGFKGHMIISLDEYSFIRNDELTNIRVENPVSLKSINVENCLNKLDENSIYNTKIDSRKSLVALSEQIDLDKDCSNIIITNGKCEPRLVMQIPNHMINFEMEQFNGYIKNLARNVGGTRAFFSTTDLETYKKSIDHLEYGSLKDVVLLEKENNKLTCKETPDIFSNQDLFEVSKFNLAESIYDYIPKELERVPDGKIRVLFKEVGKDPVIKVIDNTLEAKQELVKGLIEVVPVYEVEDTLLICNEEGKLEDMMPNVELDYDYIAGNCFFIGDDYENADFKSLTREQIIKVLDKYRYRFYTFDTDDLDIDEESLDDEVR